MNHWNSVPCAYCEARAGQACVARSGTPAREVHSDRILGYYKHARTYGTALDGQKIEPTPALERSWDALMDTILDDKTLYEEAFLKVPPYLITKLFKIAQQAQIAVMEEDGCTVSLAASPSSS